jgi:hypothetical protein
MLIIFQCYGGTHTSVVAASLYTGVLPRGRLPKLADLSALPYFDRLGHGQMGNLHFIGKDGEGNFVFALGSAGWGEEIRSLITAFLSGTGAAGEQVAVVDCLQQVTPLTRLGGILSRRLGLIRLGRPLVSLGIQKNFPHLLRLVESLENDPSPFLLPVRPNGG